MNSMFLVIVTLALTTAAQVSSSNISLIPTGPNQVEPSGNDDYDIFKEDEVIEYLAKEPRIPVNNFDFDNWDVMNEDNASLFEEFNQTILNEMKQKPNQLSSSESFTSTTRPQSTNTDVVATQRLCKNCSRCVRLRKHIPSPTRRPVRACGRTITSACASKNNTDGVAKPKRSTRCSKCASVRKLKQTRSLRARKAVCNFKKRLGTSENDTLPVSTLKSNVLEASGNETKSNGEEIGGSDYKDYEYDTEASKNPCNYERFEHPLPMIVKSGRRVSDIKCDEYMWGYKIDILDREINRRKCNDQMLKNKEKPSEVAGGFAAVQGDFPHMGAVGWIQKNGNKKWMCGSSLISPRFTLTAAHCRQASLKLGLKYTEPKLVRFGSVYLEDKANEIKNIIAEDVEIEEFLVLDEYARYPIKKYNDIGLIKLKEEVEMKMFIKPACLWSGFLGNNWVANVTGWGQTTNSKGSESNLLRYAEVDFVEQSTCKHYIQGRKNRHWFEGLKDHQFCAGKLQGGIDACRGDSGGPLQIRDHWAPVTDEDSPLDGTGIVHHVVGITSFGIQCGYPFLPGVYTNVTSFLCWIEKNVWPEDDNTFCP